MTTGPWSFRGEGWETRSVSSNGWDLDPEDAKILTLARATRARTGAAEGAAVRDTTGRTYTAATVALPSLHLSALRLAVAMAASSGADGLEAAAVVTGSASPSSKDVPEDDLATVKDLGGPEVPVFLAGPDGTPYARLTAQGSVQAER